MSPETALGVIIDILLRIMGLCIVIAENTVSPRKRGQWKYIRTQRYMMKFIQDDINLYSMLNELEDGDDYDQLKWYDC